MKRAKKRILRRIVWIGMILMAAGFLTGCMETSEDDCIVKEKETETGERIRSYSSGTEAVENVSVAEQVEAASPCMLSVEEGGSSGECLSPAGKQHEDLQGKDTLFHAGRHEWLDPYPDAGTAAEKRQGRYNSLAGTAGA